MKRVERIKTLIRKKVELGLRPVCIICGEDYRGLKWCCGIPAFVDVGCDKKDFLRVVCGEKLDWYGKKVYGFRKELVGETRGDLFIRRVEFRDDWGKEFMRCTCMKCNKDFIRPRELLLRGPYYCPRCDIGKQGMRLNTFYLCRDDDEKVDWEKWKISGKRCW